MSRGSEQSGRATPSLMWSRAANVLGSALASIPGLSSLVLAPGPETDWSQQQFETEVQRQIDRISLLLGEAAAAEANNSRELDLEIRNELDRVAHIISEEKDRQNRLRLWADPDEDPGEAVPEPHESKSGRRRLRELMQRATTHLEINRARRLVLPPRLEATVPVAFTKCRLGRYADIEKFIAELRLPPDVRDHNDNTLLMTACQHGHKRIAKLCLRKGADVDSQNLQGNTALHFCFNYGYINLGHYLVSKGARDTIQNVFGLSCYEGIRPAEVGMRAQTLRTGLPVQDYDAGMSSAWQRTRNQSADASNSRRAWAAATSGHGGRSTVASTANLSDDSDDSTSRRLARIAGTHNLSTSFSQAAWPPHSVARIAYKAPLDLSDDSDRESAHRLQQLVLGKEGRYPHSKFRGSTGPVDEVSRRKQLAATTLSDDSAESDAQVNKRIRVSRSQLSRKSAASNQSAASSQARVESAAASAMAASFPATESSVGRNNANSQGHVEDDLALLAQGAFDALDAFQPRSYKQESEGLRAHEGDESTDPMALTKQHRLRNAVVDQSVVLASDPHASNELGRMLDLNFHSESPSVIRSVASRVHDEALESRARFPYQSPFTQSRSIATPQSNETSLHSPTFTNIGQAPRGQQASNVCDTPGAGAED